MYRVFKKMMLIARLRCHGLVFWLRRSSSSSSRDRINQSPFAVLKLPTRTFCTAARCMEDLISTTCYITWSLHNKNRGGLRQFLDSFGGTEQSNTGGNPLFAGLSPDSSLGSVAYEKQDSKPRADVKLSHLALGTDSSSSIQTSETKLADLLDSTLWNRRLAPSSERIVYALVQQIFHGIREYFLASAELKFNCFPLMPVVDKLPALLREDLKSAFEDDLDNIFDITNLQHSLGLQKRDTEIELKRIKRLKEKVRQIHEQISSHEVMTKPSTDSTK